MLHALDAKILTKKSQKVAVSRSRGRSYGFLESRTALSNKNHNLLLNMEYEGISHYFDRNSVFETKMNIFVSGEHSHVTSKTLLPHPQTMPAG